MKICPVCKDTFADQLNFCDVDGVRLTQAGGGQDRNKWWSLLGAGLLIGALVITAASIFFLPRSRVPAPTVSSSEPAPAPVAPKPPAAESTASVAAPAPSSEPETAAPEALVPEVKKKDKALTNSNSSGALPNPKAAALAAEEGDKKPIAGDATTPALAPKKPEQPTAKTVSDPHSVDASTNTPPDLKKDPKAQTGSTKNQEKDSKDKKKEDEKKKGGFLKVFKKIFGKD
jgi:hypothetical protein